MLCQLRARGGGQGKKLAQAAAAWARDNLKRSNEQDAPDQPGRFGLPAGALALLGDVEEPEVVYLWPCNLPAWDAFLEVQSQWQVGFNGAVGLHYAGVLADLHARGVRGQQLRDLWPGLKACERAVLAVWAEERARREREQEQRQQHGRR